MTQEEKNLLFQDLCARLPYGVKILSNESRIICELLRGGKYDDGEIYFIATKIGCALKADEFKPFLRPMSSMTEEEVREAEKINRLTYIDGKFANLKQFTLTNDSFVDWLNEHHFDYRGLIEKGLALEAPEGMYNI